MAGPTPVSALIHAATMVTAGIYLIARSAPLYMAGPRRAVHRCHGRRADRPFAATIAVAQFDIKKVLAYSTISQLGFMVAAVGMGAFAGGMFHLMTHAFFKALLFLSAGSVILGVERGHHLLGHHSGAEEHGSKTAPKNSTSCALRLTPKRKRRTPGFTMRPAPKSRKLPSIPMTCATWAACARQCRSPSGST